MSRKPKVYTCRRCGCDIRSTKDTHITLSVKARECAIDGSGAYREVPYEPVRICPPCWRGIDDHLAGGGAS